jgi:hypothetical protein
MRTSHDAKIGGSNFAARSLGPSLKPRLIQSDVFYATGIPCFETSFGNDSFAPLISHGSGGGKLPCFHSGLDSEDPRDRVQTWPAGSTLF